MDKIIKALAYDKSVQISLINGKNIVEKARQLHNTSPLATVAIGRSLLITSLMAADLKNNDDKLSVTIKGDGPIGTIIVAANYGGNVRCSVTNPSVYLPFTQNNKFDVPAAIGKGEISVIKDMGLKYPYTGNCEIATGEISEDFAFYFLISEQTPSAVSSGVMLDEKNCVKSAGAVVIKPLPFTSDEILADLEQKTFEFKNISGLLKGKSGEDILNEIFKDKGLEITQVLFPEYKCNCSRERMDALLVSMNKSDLYETLKEYKKVEIICHFCESKYEYYKEDLDKLFNKGIHS